MDLSDLLIKYDFTVNIDYQEILYHLQKGTNIILIKKFPVADIPLQNCIRQLGVSIKESRNNNEQDVYDVRIKKQNDLFISVANSNYTFPLHTDCADFDIIPNGIGLLCVEPAIEEEGVNTFMFANELIQKIPEDKFQELLAKKWNFRGQIRNILTLDGSKYKICYDRITMQSFSKLTQQEKEELNELETLFKELSFKVKLEKGDLVLFRNDLMLHGREAIAENSNRLVKRIRFNVM